MKKKTEKTDDKKSLTNFKKPNLFILGAPKCGTTSMASWLAQHPDIYVSPIKEPHYFNTDMNYHNVENIAEYETLFIGAKNYKIVAEASVWYLYSQTAVKNIIKYSPGAKFIVMFRNPIDMAVSLHEQLYFSGYENIKDFKRAWEIQEKRKKGKSIPLLCKEASQLYYGDVCKVGEQIERLLNTVSKNRVHFINLDDIKNDPEKEYRKLLEFLELQYVPCDFVVENTAKKRKFRVITNIHLGLSKLRKKTKLYKPMYIKKIFEKIDSWNRKTHVRDKLSSDFRKKLFLYFEEDISKLERCLDKTFNNWSEK